MPLLAELDPFFHSLCPHSIGCLALQLDQTVTGLEGLYGGRQERLQPGEKDTVGTVTLPILSQSTCGPVRDRWVILKDFLL